MSNIDVLCAGRDDLLFGTQFLKDTGMDFSIPVISSNLFDIRTKNAVFRPFSLLIKGGIKILITSVIDPELPNFDIEKCYIEDPILSIDKIKKEIVHDFIVTVIHADRHRSEKFLKQLKVDLAILGSESGIIHEKLVINGASVVGNNLQGRTIGYLDAVFFDDASVVTGSPENLTVSVTEYKEDHNIQKMIERHNKWKMRFRRRLNSSKK